MIAANRQCLAQGTALLRALSDAQYADRRGTWAPVGAQYRHVLDHYQCFLDGVPARRVDYDARGRDPSIERDRGRALSVTADLDARLGDLADLDPELALAVQLQCDAGEDSWSHSTVGRELQFLVSHSVHHFALIKLLLATDGPRLNDEFGVAPSTLDHHRALR